MKVKERFKAAENSDVPLDYFLFSCYEAETTHRNAKKDNPLTWPSISDLSPDETDVEQLRDVIQDLLSWYAAQFPQLKSLNVINFGRLAEVVEPVAKLSIDVRAIAEKLTGLEFHIGASNENASDIRHQRIWDALQEFISQIFRQHQGLYLKYLQWCYEASKDEVYELGSRPPVGRFAPPMRSRFGGDRDRGGGGDRGPRQQSSHHDRPQRGGRGDGDRGRDRHQGRRDQGGPRRGHGGGGRDRDGHRGNNNNGTEVALAEVMDAVQRMREDTSLSEIPLKPANSFNRRLQHEQIKSSGFFSSSAGEGPSRAVVISRAERESTGES